MAAAVTLEELRLYCRLDQSQENDALLSSLEEAAELNDRRDGPEQQLIQADTLRELRACLTALEGQVLERYLMGESYAAIAAALGRSEKSVDNAVQRIRKKWAEALIS